MNYLKLTRTVTEAECPWLERDIPAGTIVTEFDGCTYGCISDSGVAVTVSGVQGFVEIPTDSVEPAS